MTTPEKKTFSEVAQQAMTDLNPSQEILRLCKELGVEPPTTTVRLVTDNHICKVDFKPIGPCYLASDLLKWLAKLYYDKWLVIEIDGGIFGTGIVDGSWSPGFDLAEYDADPDTAIQHLALARLRQIKQEKE